MKLTVLAAAKINISLDIVSKMDDGYHNIRTVMQSISLYDEVTVECLPGEGVVVETDLPYLPRDAKNIAAKTAVKFFEHTGIKGRRTRIRIKKNIPVCAGLGGGSADGACVLRLLDGIFETRLGIDTLRELGGSVGSDIPFCISGGTMLAEGRGDVLTALAPMPRCHVVICKPPFAFGTAELFGRVKCEKIRARPDTDGILDSLGSGDLNGITRRMYNVFEDVLTRGHRDIENIKYTLLDEGALGAVMTGSGSAVFGIFDDEQRAQEAFDKLRSNYKECFLVETVEGLEI